MKAHYSENEEHMNKSVIVTFLGISIASSVQGQGFIDWGTHFTGLFRAPIYNVDPANPGSSLSGQSALGVPAGSTVYPGALLQGTGYTFAIFAGPSSVSDPAELSLLISTTFRTTTGTSLPA